MPRTISVVPASASHPLEPARSLSASVITVSDSCASGLRIDASGPAVREVLEAAGFAIAAAAILPDEQALLEDALRTATTSASLVVTTGGTGITTRDITPEATRAVCPKLLDGLGEQMRNAGLRETPFAILSRGVCGIFGQSLILNLPGSPRGAVSSLRAVLPVLPHALGLLRDPNSPHPSDAPAPERLR